MKNNLKNDVFNQDFFPYVTMIDINMQYEKNIRVKFPVAVNVRL